MRSDCMATAGPMASVRLATEKNSMKGKLFRTLNEGRIFRGLRSTFGDLKCCSVTSARPAQHCSSSLRGENSRHGVSGAH